MFLSRTKAEITDLLDGKQEDKSKSEAQLQVGAMFMQYVHGAPRRVVDKQWRWRGDLCGVALRSGTAVWSSFLRPSNQASSRRLRGVSIYRCLSVGLWSGDLVSSSVVS